MLGVKSTPRGFGRVGRRWGEAAARHSEALSQYHADSRSPGAPTPDAPPVVVLSVDGSMLGMQVRKQRRRRPGGGTPPPLPPGAEGQFPEGKNRGLPLPSRRGGT